MATYNLDNTKATDIFTIMKLNEQETKAVLDALIFTFSGDACYDELEKQNLKIIMEKIIKEYPDIEPTVTLWEGSVGFDDEDNSKFVKHLIKNLKVE